MKPSTDKAITAIKDAQLLLQNAKVELDRDEDILGLNNLEDARSELSNASNAIDDAMGLIDDLMQPEPTESERTGD